MIDSESQLLNVSDTLHDKVVQAYIQSNAFWPQTRASFVIVALGVLESRDVALLRAWSSGEPQPVWRTEAIVLATDRVHRLHNISTVLPTRIESVERELNQSCKVLLRTWEIVRKTENSDLSAVEDLNLPARNIWTWVRSSEFVLKNKELISGPSSGSAFAQKVAHKDNPQLGEFYRSMQKCFEFWPERILLSALSEEILHDITVVRPQF